MWNVHHAQGSMMKKLLLLAMVAIALSSVSMAGHEVAVLDGTSWKVDVDPDSMAKDAGEKQFKETMTFADGKVSLSAPKVGFESTPYSVTMTGKDLTFKAERTSAGEGSSVWTGSIHGGNLDGKLIWTKNDGTVLTYTLRGNKLD
jgi:opacity protein-like surface antigen